VDRVHKIEAAPYGFKVTVLGVIDGEEIEEIRLRLLEILSDHDRAFSLMVDMREVVTLSTEVSKLIEELHRACRRMSMERAVAVVRSPVIRGQISQISFNIAASNTDRVIDASKVPEWEERAIAWVADGVEPTPELDEPSSQAPRV